MSPLEEALVPVTKGGFTCEHDACAAKSTRARWSKPGGWCHVDAKAPVYACDEHKPALLVRAPVAP